MQIVKKKSHIYFVKGIESRLMRNITKADRIHDCY